jgi:hypothetical protein
MKLKFKTLYKRVCVGAGFLNLFLWFFAYHIGDQSLQVLSILNMILLSFVLLIDSK